MMNVYGLWDTIILLAVPLFILMGTLLEQSGLAEDLYTFMHGVFGRLRGGLAIGTDIICTIFAAMTGISGAATVTMGIVALPAMLKRGYSKTLAIGCIAGGGALGILIPPSIVMVVFALFAEESVGKLFIGGILPGLMLSGMFIVYIAVRAYLQPNLAPALEKGEAYHLKQTLTAARGLILPFMVIILVLGSMFTGIATPTEAAAVGAFGMFIAAFVRGKFSYEKLKKALLSAFNVSAMMFWIIIGGQLFTSVYIAL